MVGNVQSDQTGSQINFSLQEAAHVARATRRTLVVPRYCVEPLNTLVSDPAVWRAHPGKCHPFCRHFDTSSLGVPSLGLDAFAERVLGWWAEARGEGWHARSAYVLARKPANDSSVGEAPPLLEVLPQQPGIGRVRSVVTTTAAQLLDLLSGDRFPLAFLAKQYYMRHAWPTTGTGRRLAPIEARAPLSPMVRGWAACLHHSLLRGEPFWFLQWRTERMTLHPDWCAQAVEARLAELDRDRARQVGPVAGGRLRVVLSTDVPLPGQTAGAGSRTLGRFQNATLAMLREAVGGLATRLGASTATERERILPRNVSASLVDLALTRLADAVLVPGFKRPVRAGRYTCARMGEFFKLLEGGAKVWAEGEPAPPRRVLDPGGVGGPAEKVPGTLARRLPPERPVCGPPRASGGGQGAVGRGAQPFAARQPRRQRRRLGAPRAALPWGRGRDVLGKRRARRAGGRVASVLLLRAPRRGLLRFAAIRRGRRAVGLGNRPPRG